MVEVELTTTVKEGSVHDCTVEVIWSAQAHRLVMIDSPHL